MPTLGPLIVMYHGIGGEDGVSPSGFAEQLDLLTERRQVVSLREAIASLGTVDSGSLAAITFDDGYRDFADFALPVLRAKSLHATLFVPAGHIGGHNAWDEGVLPRREILGSGELEALDQRHVEIGAHGYSHCRLAALDSRALERETREARDRLEAVLERRIELFAYPFGQLDDFDRAAEEAVARAGFLAACSTRFGRGSGPRDRFRLRRIGIAPGDTPSRVAAKLDGGYDFVALKESLGARIRQLRARAVGSQGLRSAQS